MNRVNDGADNLIDLYFPVLDYGFVRLCDYMGTDTCIEEAARVSYQQGTRKVSQTRGLLRYLRKHRHSSPFEMVDMKFHISMPIFCMRQWVRHRTASLNEISGRYSLLPTMFYLPTQDNFNKQSKTNNQGRDDNVLSNDKYNEYKIRWESLRKTNSELYKSLTEDEVAREIARIDLPLSTYTQFYWKANLHNILHLLTLRTDSHAQLEIREFANVIAGMVKIAFPLTYEAWKDYDLNSVSFSLQEQNCLNAILNGKSIDSIENGLCKDPSFKSDYGMSDREFSEFKNKLSMLGNNNLKDFNLDLTSAKDAKYFEDISNKFSL